MNEYISVKEAAEKMGVTPQHVSLLCRTNKISGAKKDNGKWIIPVETHEIDDIKPNGTKPSRVFRYIFHQGIDRVATKNGFQTECVFAADNDPAAAKVYEKNYGKKCLYDLKEDSTHRLIDAAIGEKELTCLFGGFPCQPFSKAGNQEGFSNQMKGTLYFEIEKIVHRYHPKLILLENVRNLKAHDGGHTWAVIRNSLIQEGYAVDDVIISPNNIAAIPALRERFFILAYHREKLEIEGQVK